MDRHRLLIRARLAAAEVVHAVRCAVSSQPGSSRPSTLTQLEERVLFSATAAPPPAADSTGMEQPAQFQTLSDEITAASAGMPEPSADATNGASSAVVTTTDAMAQGDAIQERSLPDTADSGEGHRQELVFLDTSVADYEQLLDDLWAHHDPTRDIQVVLLSSQRDGIEQITEALRSRERLSAIHIISHGADGAIEIGSTHLDAARLAVDAEAVARWGQALSDDGDLLLYGCDVAQDAAGQAFVQNLARLTGADVAASEDLTGHTLFGGNWDLEYQSGSIETAVAADLETQRDWFGLMSVAVDATSTGSASTANSVTFSHSTASASDRLMLVGVSMDATGGSAVTSVTYGGQSLTLVGTLEGGANPIRVEIWRLVNPAAGTANLVVNLNRNADGVSVGVTTFTGVNQTSPLGAFASAIGTSASPSVDVTSASGELVYDVVAGKDATSLTHGTGQTELWELANGAGNQRGAGSTAAGAATVTMSWSKTTSGTAEWAIGAVPIKAAVANTAPTITLPATALSYTENGPAAIIDATATASDSDSPDFDTGTLTIDFSANGTASDRLAVRNEGTGAGQIGVAGANVTYSAVTIGTWTGGTGTTPLVITFNASSTPAAAQALMRNITYANVSEDPSTTSRTVRFVLTDGDGGSSAAVTETISVTAVIDHLLTVDTISNALDGTTTSIDALLANRGADGVISLREAIAAANNTVGADTINFNIVGAGPYKIDISTALPTITESVIIDGTSEPDYVVGTPVVRIDGAAAASAASASVPQVVAARSRGS